MRKTVAIVVRISSTVAMVPVSIAITSVMESPIVPMAVMSGNAVSLQLHSQKKIK